MKHTYSQCYESTETLERYKEEALNRCSILYSGREKPLTQSLMGLGWECGIGWNRDLNQLSYELEALNLQFYPKYRTRIEATQVKEKYGTLRFYYDVVIDPPKVRCWFRNKILDTANKLENIDYSKVRVIIKEPYITYSDTEITEPEKVAELTERYKNDTERNVIEKDGKWYIHEKIHHYGRYTYKPTKHRILFKIKNILFRLSNLLSEVTPTDIQEMIYDFMTNRADELIHDTERMLYDVCEHCGHIIHDISESNGDIETSRICTKGWVSYICKECYDKARENPENNLDGTLYEDGIFTGSFAKENKNNAVAMFEKISKYREEHKKEFYD